MECTPEIPQKPARDRNALEDTTVISRERQLRRERFLMGAWVGGTALTLIATFMLLEGCGSDRTSHTRSASHTNPTPSANSAVVASNDAVAPGGGLELSQPVNSEVTDPGSVPPDVAVAVSDTFVTAGQAVEVTVEGTPDVTEMALSDGRGDAIPMVRDASGQVWRVGYRVPLRPHTDRLGLSVTAKNDAHRWRRVWLFLQVGDGKQNVETGEAQQDSTIEK